MGRRSRSRADRADAPAGTRERLGPEAPGSVLRGPPIALTCECGVNQDVRYGETWTCEQCGRSWDTGQIPREQYEAIRRTQLRFRALPVALGLLVAAIAIFFTLTGNVFSVFLLLPISITVWFVFLRPAHRRRYRRAIADLPRWELHPQ